MRYYKSFFHTLITSQNGSSNQHPGCSKRLGHHRYSVLVHTTGAADMVQLEEEEDRWVAGVDDVLVGNVLVL